MFTELILAFKKIVDDVENKKNSQLARDERYRLTQLRNRAEAATLAQTRDKGILLNRARQSANLKNEVITQHIVETGDDITQSVDDISVFGLRASLQHPDNLQSFEIWRIDEDTQMENNEIHVEQAPLSVLREEPLVIREVALEGKPVPHSWQELSVHTALKLIDNNHTPADVLLALAGHLSTEVRSQLIDNPSLPMEAIMLLLNDEDPDVRYSLAESYHLDRAILETLTGDENPYISARAETTVRKLSGGNIVHEGNFGGGDVIPLRARA